MCATLSSTRASLDDKSRLIETAHAWQKKLEINPRHPQALVAMSLVALASHQVQAAVAMASMAVQSAPAWGAAWVALGQALKSSAQMANAEDAYLHAIRLKGTDELAHLGLGELRLAQARPVEAIAEFERGLRTKPALVAAHLGLGNALALLERTDQAFACYQRALSLRPHLPEAAFALGILLAKMGRRSEAVQHYRRALAWRPDFAAAWMNLGSLLREDGREVYAEAALQRAVELRPDLVSGWVNLAVLERERHRPAKVAEYLRRAFALNPDQPEMHIAWCQFRAAEKDLPGAWGWLRWAIARDPDAPETSNMQGILLHKEGRFAEAVHAFERAEALGHRAAASNRGNALLDLGRMPEALHAHQAAVDRDPEHPGARYNLALTQLRLGEWEHGWSNYESRWRFREVHRSPRAFTQPRWRGEPLDGQRILLHAEQGLGDTLQFCRYATLVAARGGSVVLKVQPAAERLLQSLPVVRAGLAKTATLVSHTPDFDVECPLMSLPAVFETAVDTVPWQGAYLGADSELAAARRRQFPDLQLRNDRSLRVGIAWAGNPRYKADAQRSLALAALIPLLRTPGVHWFSLQKGPAAGQLSTLPPDISVYDASSHDEDLAETAALLSHLDLVITTDTCIAHLAGAMAKKVWVLLPHLSDWRWMQSLETSPWYPTARLIRQSCPDAWPAVINFATLLLMQQIQGLMPCRRS